jgi:hypothetical protein
VERVEMHRLQELVRLHLMGTGAREVARLLAMSPNTERVYREALQKAELLAGDPNDLPELEKLRDAVRVQRPLLPVPQQVSSIDHYAERVRLMSERGAGPTAIYDRLLLEDAAFSGSLSAVKAVRPASARAWRARRRRRHSRRDRGRTYRPS